MKDNLQTPSGDSLYNGVGGSIFATLAYLVGGFDNVFIAYAIFVAMDYFTGALAGWYTAKLSSDRAFRGLAKKCGMMCFAVVATQLDYLGGGDGYLRWVVLSILIGTEGLSIMENLARLGLPIPRILYDRLEQLQAGDNGGLKEMKTKEEKTNG